jgi:hypothetical protein
VGEGIFIGTLFQGLYQLVFILIMAEIVNPLLNCNGHRQENCGMKSLQREMAFQYPKFHGVFHDLQDLYRT